VDRTISSKAGSDAANDSADTTVQLPDRRTRRIGKKFNAAPKTGRQADFRKADGFMDFKEQTPEITALQTQQTLFEGLQGSTPSVLWSAG
jgi:hypothetical protein